jgi:hypothetical protein
MTVFLLACSVDVAASRILEEIRLTPPRLAKKPHRYRPGTVALREIRRYQKSTKL